eukprot:6172884-Pleurochrysis_carterae.AAC.1
MHESRNASRQCHMQMARPRGRRGKLRGNLRGNVHDAQLQSSALHIVASGNCREVYISLSLLK